MRGRDESLRDFVPATADSYGPASGVDWFKLLQVMARVFTVWTKTGETRTVSGSGFFAEPEEQRA